MTLTKRTYYIFAALIVVVAGAGIYFLVFSKTVEVGDTVFVNYTGYLDTGEIFDTTFEDVAMDDSQPKVWWFKLKAHYEPLEIVLGQGYVLPDFEMALIGMREGDKKEIAIPPERAAGYRDPAKITEVPLVQMLNKEEELTKEQFLKAFGQDPVVDKDYQFQGLPVKVTEVAEETVRFVLQLQVGQEIFISLGHGSVTGETETEYQITLTPELGDILYTPYGQGHVIEIREDAMLVDFNQPLAGETLHYTIWVVSIEKAA